MDFLPVINGLLFVLLGTFRSIYQMDVA